LRPVRRGATDTGRRRRTRASTCTAPPRCRAERRLVRASPAPSRPGRRSCGCGRADARRVVLLLERTIVRPGGAPVVEDAHGAIGREREARGGRRKRRRWHGWSSSAAATCACDALPGRHVQPCGPPDEFGGLSQLVPAWRRGAQRGWGHINRYDDSRGVHSHNSDSHVLMVDGRTIPFESSARLTIALQRPVSGHKFPRVQK
jgi:hypothetical protein